MEFWWCCSPDSNMARSLQLQVWARDINPFLILNPYRFCSRDTALREKNESVGLFPLFTCHKPPQTSSSFSNQRWKAMLYKVLMISRGLGEGKTVTAWLVSGISLPFLAPRALYFPLVPFLRRLREEKDNSVWITHLHVFSWIFFPHVYLRSISWGGAITKWCDAAPCPSFLHLDH